MVPLGLMHVEEMLDRRSGRGRCPVCPQAPRSGAVVTAAIRGRWASRGSACQFVSPGFVCRGGRFRRSYAALHGEGAVNDRRTRYMGFRAATTRPRRRRFPGRSGCRGRPCPGRSSRLCRETGEFHERDLSNENVVAIVLDGKTFAEATMVIALGIT